MTKVQLLKRILPFTTLLVTILSVIPYPGSLTNIISQFGNTTIWWIIQTVVIYLFWQSKTYLTNKNDVRSMLMVLLYLAWNMFSFIRGMFIAETYWDWKFLIGNTLALLVPIAAYAASNKLIVQSILSFYFKYTLPLFIIFAFLIDTGAYGFYLVPISFIMLFFPILTIRWKFIIGVFTLLVLLVDFDARSNVIKFGVPVLLLSIYYFRVILPNKLFEWIRKLLFITPLVLFTLAVTDIFNVFNMDNYINGDYVEVKKDTEGNLIESDIKADTRTFLYVEVLQTAKKYNSWWMGRSPAHGNESEAFGDWAKDITGRAERNGNEVAILNIFTWTGIIGVILYLLTFYRASWLAVNRSNNIFSKMTGLAIAFRWLYAWVEDINYFTLTTFFLWLMIGICFSKSFRAMNNKDVENWVRGIFNIHYKKNHKKVQYGASY